MPKPYAIVEQHLDIDTSTWQAARDGSGVGGLLPRPRIVGYYDRLDEAQVVLESAADSAKMLQPSALVVVGDGLMISLRQREPDRSTALTIQAVVLTGGERRRSPGQVTLAEAMAASGGPLARGVRFVESQPSTVEFGTLFNQSVPPAPPIIEEDDTE